MISWEGDYNYPPEGLVAVQTLDADISKRVVFHVSFWNIQPAYEQRYKSTYNFSEGLAIAQNSEGRWFHIRPNGIPAYIERYDHVDHFHEGRAAVNLLRSDGQVDAWHILYDGTPAYEERYAYAMRYIDGGALVQRHNGQAYMIDYSGARIRK